MRKEIMKGEKTSTDLSNVRRWMAIAAVPLFALICSFALKSEAYADVMEHTVEISVEGTDTAECMAIASVDQTAQGETVTITASPANRFQGWNVILGGVTLNSTTDPETTFVMGTDNVTIIALFTDPPLPPTSPNPPNDDSSGDPPKSDDPDPNEPMREFLDDVQNQAKELINHLKSGKQIADGYGYIASHGFTIDAGTWESFDKNTAEILDELIARGVRVNINYIHNNVNKTVTIPRRYKYKLKDMCDKNGFVGFEYIYATVANGKRPDEETTHTTVMGATVSMAALRQGNDFVGSATEGLSMPSNTAPDGASAFAQMGGGSVRQETG